MPTAAQASFLAKLAKKEVADRAGQHARCQEPARALGESSPGWGVGDYCQPWQGSSEVGALYVATGLQRPGALAAASPALVPDHVDAAFSLIHSEAVDQQVARLFGS